MRLIKLVFIALLLWNRTAMAENAVNVQSFTRHNGELLEVLIEFDIQPGWHMFAPYEQEFGTPLKINWQLPEGTQVLEESFSLPQRFNQQDFSFDGYEKQAFYKTTLKADQWRNNIPLTITWQVCAEECIPGEATFNIVPRSDDMFGQKLNQAAEHFLSHNYRPQINFGLILLMAFGGGVILNLMPCVFPILGLKIIVLTRTTKEKRQKEALFYTLGVMSSMLVVATILLIIRRFDSAAGWGFQLQSPWFVGFMFVLFIILSLLMFNVISFNSGWLSRLAVLEFRNRNLNSFMTGLLAVLIASPCTAPFMGAAVGYALMSPAYVYFPVFGALGLGYAFPFAMLSLYPQGVRRILPKPGKWMNVLKTVLSLPLVLTAVWLGWVLLTQLGIYPSGKSLIWQEYSRAKTQELVARKRPLFIDFTAKWCITCLVNKKAALQSDKMAQLVKDNKIVLLRADATNQDAEVSAGLAYYGRASVPLYIYYDGKSDDYWVLPQILTPGILEEYLQ